MYKRQIQFIPGAMNAASCEFYVTVTGKSCHGAHPSDGIDSLLPACAMVGALQSIITRKIDPAEAALITVGQFHSGTKNNIISGETKFSGIIRTLNMEQDVYKRQLLPLSCMPHFFCPVPRFPGTAGWLSQKSHQKLTASRVLFQSYLLT